MRLLTALLAAALLLGLGKSSAQTQDQTENEEPTAPPVLPETEVVAEPPAAPDVFDLPPTPADFTPPTILDESVFSTPPTDGYRAESSTVGTLIDVPDVDFPGSTSVVPEDLLEDQQVLEFDELLRNVSGAVPVADGLFPDRFFLRGLEVRSRDYRKDGFLDPTFAPRDFANIERVEILKGPASVLYGSSAPSGTVNLITKKPKSTRFSRFAINFGSFGLQRFTADANERANEDGSVLYRVNVAHEESNTFRDFGFVDRTLVAAAATWLVDDDTSFTLLGEYHRDERRGDRGLPAIAGDALELPPERYVGEPDNDFLDTEEYRLTLLFERRINEDWQLELGGSTLFYSFPGSQTNASAESLLGEPFFRRTRQDILKEDEQSHSLRANLAGEFDTGRLLHKSLIGLEYVYFDSDSIFSVDTLYPPINVVRPVYRNPPATISDLTIINFPVFRQQRVGFFLQDLVELNEHWLLLAGVRFDTIDFTFDRNLVAGILSERTEQDFSRASPRAGIVWQPIPDDLAFYFNYSQSFNPPSGSGFVFPDTLEPELGESFELGLKAVLVDGLSFNAAAFHVTRRNSPFLLFPQLIQVGRERSQGVELNLVGELTERWNVTANWTYSDTELTDDENPDIFGQPQRNVPLNAANLWTRYNVVQNERRTAGLAVGLVHLGERTANLAADLELPAYTRWDAGLYYKCGQLDASLYVENVFDIHYAASSIDEFQIFPGAPVTARGQLGVRF